MRYKKWSICLISLSRLKWPIILFEKLGKLFSVINSSSFDFPALLPLSGVVLSFSTSKLFSPVITAAVSSANIPFLYSVWTRDEEKTLLMGLLFFRRRMPVWATGGPDDMIVNVLSAGTNVQITTYYYHNMRYNTVHSHKVDPPFSG